MSLKIFVINHEITVANPVQVLSAASLVDDDLLLVAHVNELLDRVLDEHLVNHFTFAIFADFVEDTASERRQLSLEDTVAPHVQRCRCETLVTLIFQMESIKVEHDFVERVNEQSKVTPLEQVLAEELLRVTDFGFDLALRQREHLVDLSLVQCVELLRLSHLIGKLENAVVALHMNDRLGLVLARLQKVKDDLAVFSDDLLGILERRLIIDVHLCLLVFPWLIL